MNTNRISFLAPKDRDKNDPDEPVLGIWVDGVDLRDYYYALRFEMKYLEEIRKRGGMLLISSFDDLSEIPENNEYIYVEVEHTKGEIIFRKFYHLYEPTEFAFHDGGKVWYATRYWDLETEEMSVVPVRVDGLHGGVLRDIPTPFCFKNTQFMKEFKRASEAVLGIKPKPGHREG